METVAVFGASGHVGGTLVERLWAQGSYDVRPIIHTSGNAWRLSRYGRQLWSADLLDRRQIRAALAGCPYVVNCSFPPAEAMVASVQNLLGECCAAGVKRFVHLSSVAVYGEPPPPESVDEEARPRALRGSYGWYKWKQDRLVARAARAGLECVVLCPPNITGPNSLYLLEILDNLRRGSLPLVEEGRMACMLADVVNVAAGIEAALTCACGDGQRIFVNDDEPTTWADVVAALLPLAGNCPAPATISAGEARAFVRQGSRANSPLEAMRAVAAVPEVRSILKNTPSAVKAVQLVRRMARILPEGLKRRWVGPRGVFSPRADAAARPASNSRLCAHQLRGVRHSCQRARALLGYQPPIPFANGMELFRQWYETYHGYGSEDWPLLSELYLP